MERFVDEVHVGQHWRKMYTLHSVVVVVCRFWVKGHQIRSTCGQTL